MSDNTGRVVTVEILGQRYPVRSSLDPGYVGDLATYVDEKMRSAADKSPAADSLKVAVLAALNIADEYFRCRDADRSATDDVRKRAMEIEQVVDQALAEFR